ncbi:unnamed protein product, partial [Callosobruchus maculatus]
MQEKSSDVGAPYPGCREAIRESYKRRGLAEDCIPVLLASLSDNTIKQYNASLQKWWTFCSEDNLDVFNSDNTTRPKRSREDSYLLITYKKPYHVASSQTLSRWIKKALQNSGIDISKFKGHSTRHAAVSAANRQGVSIETIRNAAGWTGKSDMFARFYNRPVLD